MTRTERDWSSAGHRGRRCRLAELDPGHVCDGPRQMAHVSGRRHERPGDDGVIHVYHLDVVPLCRGAHDRYDGRAQPPLDLLPYLSPVEQARAVAVLGSIQAAMIRLGGGGGKAPLPRGGRR